ncbi:hypothetical protein F5Y17DRAFT_281298 [Xylariaceae sp. FL0594]|nr:hypothetical protein F5Y17DRAFT_281298 [Xylariaceae sp. FL0594]
MNRKDQNSLMERHERIMAQILTRFSNMIRAATAPVAASASISQASVNVMTMNSETAALIKEVENLLALSREIKALWVAGPLHKRSAERDAAERETDERAATVAALYNQLIALQNAGMRRAEESAGVGPGSATASTATDLTPAEAENGDAGGDADDKNHVKMEAST